MPYVYSTSANNGTYCDYGPGNSDDKNRGHHVARKKVTIRGGHGVAAQQKGAGYGGIHTPMGVMTEVNDEDMEFLLQNKSFQRHIAAGFITYDKKKVDPAKRAQDMAPKDGGAPVTPKDFEESENSSPDARIYKRKETIGEEVVNAPKPKSKK